MKYVTYSDLAARHGKRPAHSLLKCIERLAQIKHEVISMDMDARFERALKALSDIDFAA